MFTVEMIENDVIPLVAYPHQGDYMGIGQVFEQLFLYANTHNLLSEQTRSIGIYYDDPKSVAVEQLRAMACISLDAGIEVSGDGAPERMSIPAMQCATLVFKGSYAELSTPYDWLFGQWLPQSGFEAADFPPFEEYLNDPKDTPPNELLTKIYCPLK